MSDAREPPPDDNFEEIEDKDDLFTSTKETFHDEVLEQTEEPAVEGEPLKSEEDNTMTAVPVEVKDDPPPQQKIEDDEDEDLFKDDDDEEDPVTEDLSEISLSKSSGKAEEKPAEEEKKPVEEVKKPVEEEKKVEQKLESLPKNDTSVHLGNAEEHTALSRALAQLSEAFEKVEGLHQEVANSDYYNVSEVIGDYLRVIAEINEVFQVRVKSWANWQTAEANLTKKKELETRLQQQNRTEKLPNVQTEIKELESRVKTCKREFDDLSATIKKEITKFEQNRVLDFKQILLTFLKTLMKSQEQNIKFWEAFLPEAKAIA